MRLAQIAKILKDFGQTEVRMDRAASDLIVEMVTEHPYRHHSYEDAQILGVFHIYEATIGDVRVRLESNLYITQEEAQKIRYTGLSLEAVREMIGKDRRP